MPIQYSHPLYPQTLLLTGRYLQHILLSGLLFIMAAPTMAQGLPPGFGLKTGAPVDEAMAAFQNGNLTLVDYERLKKGADDDYFADMDGGVTLPENTEKLMKTVGHLLPGRSPEEVREAVVLGRNNWNVWTGGNDKFWTHLGKAGFGQIDFLKTLSNHPDATARRSRRWQELGLVNEPCFRENLAPRDDRWGLWLDTRDSSCPEDPFENSKKYPGIKVGSRGQTLRYKNQDLLHESSSYGLASGVIGLRLFPNPKFDKKAAARWDADRYYTDPSYFNDPKLVKPYRVGMACAFCHVGPDPVNPPKNFNAPAWENLSSTVGSQYYWVDRIYFWNYKKNRNNLIYQLLHTARPGTLDTSLISSDQINNPRTMNAIYSFDERLNNAIALHHKETLQKYNRETKQYNHFAGTLIPEASPLLDLATSDRNMLLAPGRTRHLTRRTQGSIEVVAPRVLKDGSDSAGVLAALNRVYVNIGLYSEEWLTHFTPLIGGRYISPFDIQAAKRNSLFWQANTSQTPNVSLFLAAASSPHRLPSPAPSEANSDVLDRGKIVFAQNCASCHSSKLPDGTDKFFASEQCQGAGYRKCWDNFWEFSQSDPTYMESMEQIVLADDFLENNYLSTEARVPVDLLGVQTCSSEATNGIAKDIWAEFTSDSYKSLPSVFGAQIVSLQADGTYRVEKRNIPGGGRGYIRPPSLSSLWSTAPYLGNNSVGRFSPSATRETRLALFEEGIDRLLNPEMRISQSDKDTSQKLVSYTWNGHEAKGVVDVFSSDAYVMIPKAYIPSLLYKVLPKSFKVQRTSADTPTQEERQTALVNLTMESTYDPNTPSQTKAERDAATLEALGESVILGPFPKGFPINLITNMDLSANPFRLIGAVRSLFKGFAAAKKAATPEESLKRFTEITADKLRAVSKCPDLVVNKGHFFGTKFLDKDSKGLSSQDQDALKQFLKTL